MIPTDDIKAQYSLLHHGSKDEQIERLKDKLAFWRAAAVTLGVFVVGLILLLLKRT